MRTIAYVDGYNLFYSILTGSPYKWLDLFTLFENHIIPDISPDSELIQIKYFTAPALGRLAKDPKVEQRQAHYHKALKARGNIETIKGYHQSVVKKGILANPPEGHPLGEKVEVHLMEEKQTDVNIGLHMYRDAMHGNCDHVILCSNDADLEPVIEMIRADCPEVQISVVLPRKPGSKSRLSTRLLKNAHKKRRSINEEELAASQLPSHSLDHRNRAIKRPTEW